MTNIFVLPDSTFSYSTIFLFLLIILSMKSISVPNFNSLSQALSSLFGTSVSITRTEGLSGGDINRAYALTLNTGLKIFMKANAKENAAFFTSEAAALSAIEKTAAIRTPKVFCTGTDNEKGAPFSFLLLEFIESGKRTASYWKDFGQKLAAMHNAETSDFLDTSEPVAEVSSSAFTSIHRFGFFQDNFIGASPQVNTPSEKWITFFRDYRLLPQFKRADRYFNSGDRKKITRLLDNLETFLVEPEKPSLLHGDLWQGNQMCSSDGNALLIDPASYVGHAEADLAMTELFGAFPPDFYAGYKEIRPLQSGYENRRNLYNLYQLLNHLNLFGSSYLFSVLHIVDEYVA